MEMTPREKDLLAFVSAATELGLHAVIIDPGDAPPCSVDIQLVLEGQVRAAMRVIAWDKAWRVELPMRNDVADLHNGRLVYLAPLNEKITADTLRKLDYWFGQVPGSGRPPAPKPVVEPGKNTLGWMKLDYWDKRLKRNMSTPH